MDAGGMESLHDDASAKGESPRPGRVLMATLLASAVGSFAGSVPAALATGTSHSPSQPPSTLGNDGYLFGGEWATLIYGKPSASGRAESITQRRGAVDLASRVVDIATKASGAQLSPTSRRNLIQWILSGHVGPADAADMVIGGEQSKTQFEAVIAIARTLSGTGSSVASNQHLPPILAKSNVPIEQSESDQPRFGILPPP